MPSIRLKGPVTNQRKSSLCLEPYSKPPNLSRRFHPNIMSQTLSACITLSYAPEVNDISVGHQKADARKTTADIPVILAIRGQVVQRWVKARTANAGAGNSPCQSLTMKATPNNAAAM